MPEVDSCSSEKNIGKNTYEKHIEKTYILNNIINLTYPSITAVLLQYASNKYHTQALLAQHFWLVHPNGGGFPVSSA